MGNILEVKNLNKCFKGFSLDDVSFTLKKGYIMGFIGPNGSGKTTTIKLIMNLMKKESGKITFFDNLNHDKNEKKIKQRIGFVYDENHFYEDFTVTEMKNIISRFYQSWDDKVFANYLHVFELPPRKKIKDLSKGMKLKFSIAIALSHNADLIIMDEPTSGLDPIFRNEMLEILSDHIQDENKSVLFSTHITTDLEKIADYITFIHKGKIVFSEEKDFVLESYAIVKGDKKFLDRDVRKQFIGIRENRFGFEGLMRDIKHAHDLFGSNTIIEKPSLDQIMLYTVRREIHA
jgi:ABC-2 type transport system ATP-binding protein